MAKTFNEDQMRDPWRWCLQKINEYHISSKMMSDATGAPRSTLRALFNGTNRNPRYDLLMDILKAMIDLENGEDVFGLQMGKTESSSEATFDIESLL